MATLISVKVQLRQTCDHANVFIKVSATEEGLPAIRQLISAGVNVNVISPFTPKARVRRSDEVYQVAAEEIVTPTSRTRSTNRLGVRQRCCAP